MLTQKKKQFTVLKASGMNTTQAVLKSHPGIKYNSARAYGSKLMKQNEVNEELTLLKDIFRKEFVSTAFKNWKLILETIPNGKLNWADWIKANRDSFELAGIKEDSPIGIKQYNFIGKFIKKEYIDKLVMEKYSNLQSLGRNKPRLHPGKRANKDLKENET